MALTTAQLALLRAEIDGDPTLSAIPNNGDGWVAVRDILNLQADPAFIVWKASVSQDEIMQNGFDWVRVDNLSIGKARIWEWLFNNQSRSCNPSKANVRIGIDECWKGTQADLDVRAAVYIHCKRSASRVEKLLATGTGTDAVPATMGFEGPLSASDVEMARA